MTPYMKKMFRKHPRYLPSLFPETVTYLDDATFTAKDSDYTLYTFSLLQSESNRLSEELTGMTCCLIAQRGGHLATKYWLYIHDFDEKKDMRFGYTLFHRDPSKNFFESGIICSGKFPIKVIKHIQQYFWAVLMDLPENRLLHATGVIQFPDL